MSIDFKQFLHSGAIVSLSNDKLLVGWGERSHLPYSHLDPCQPAFYLNDFFLEIPCPWVQYAQCQVLSLNEFKQLLPTLSSSFKALSWELDPQSDFEKHFALLQKLLLDGCLQKAVPYLFAQSSTRMDFARLNKCLQRAIEAQSKGHGFAYGYWDQEKGIVGVTPEKLFWHHLDQPQKVETVALAGTCHPNEDLNQFICDHKEQQEHQLVVEGIRNSLKALGSVDLGKLQLKQLTHLTHFMTPISLNLHKSFDFEELVYALHPTPALGTFPKELGRTWLIDYQNHKPRHFFGAPMGFQCQECSGCFVAIRNVQWTKDKLFMGAGCGVVRASQSSKEYREIQLKIHAIQHLLGLF